MGNIKNPDAFNYEAGGILAALFEAFPTPADWELDPDNEIYPTEMGSSRQQIQEKTLWWLIENGYIQGNGRVGDKFLQLQLTPKGLEALKMVPKALGTNEPFIELLKKEIAAKSVGGIGLAIKAMWDYCTATPSA